MGIVTIKIADQSGTVRQYQSLQRNADENSTNRIRGKDKNGNDAIFTKIKTQEGKYMYVLCNEGEEVQPPKNSKMTDALIAPLGPDKKGVLTTGEKMRAFGKGLISTFTNLFSNPWVTGGVILGTVAVGIGCAFFPPLAAGVAAVTPFLAKAGLAIGAVQVGYGAYQAGTANTDKEAKKGWENMGAGVFSIGTSAISLWQAGKAATAAKAAADGYKHANETISAGFKAANGIVDDAAAAAAETIDKLDDVESLTGATIEACRTSIFSRLTNPITQTFGNTKLAEYSASLNAAKGALNISGSGKLQSAVSSFNTLLQKGDVAGATKILDICRTAANSLTDSSKATQLLTGMETALSAIKAGALNPASSFSVLTTAVGAGGLYEATNDDIDRLHKEITDIHILAN